MMLLMLVLITVFNIYMVIYYPNKPRIWMNKMGAAVGLWVIFVEFIRTFS